MFGKKKETPPTPVVSRSIFDPEYRRQMNEKNRAEVARELANIDAYDKKYHPEEYRARTMTKEERHQDLLKKMDIDPYRQIRQQNQEFESDKHIDCVITREYIVDTWLMLAQKIYYDKTNPDKRIEKQVVEFNNLLSSDFTVRAYLASNFGNWYQDNLENGGRNSLDLKLFAKENKGGCSLFGFDFKPIDRKDTDYLAYLNKYCEEKYHTPLNRLDTTFTPEIAALFMADFIDRGIDYNFISFYANRFELKQTLLLRARHQITRSEFLSLSDYGKSLLLKDAIYSNVGIYVYPSPIYANLSKLQTDFAKMAEADVKRTYGMDSYEISKDLSIKYLYDAFEQKMNGKIYPIYYFDDSQKPKRLPAYAIDNHTNNMANNYKYGGKPFNPTKEIVSIKEVNNSLGDLKIVYDLKNIAREYGINYETSNGQFASPTEYQGIINHPPESGEVTCTLNELCRKFNTMISITDYIDESELFAEFINLNMLTKDFQSVPMDDLAPDEHLSQDETIFR